ncbi:hypothetical protein GCM10023083_57190 [Streptomyces phyllanthi]
MRSASARLPRTGTSPDPLVLGTTLSFRRPLTKRNSAPYLKRNNAPLSVAVLKPGITPDHASPVTGRTSPAAEAIEWNAHHE